MRAQQDPVAAEALLGGRPVAIPTAWGRSGRPTAGARSIDAFAGPETPPRSGRPRAGRGHRPGRESAGTRRRARASRLLPGRGRGSGRRGGSPADRALPRVCAWSGRTTATSPRRRGRGGRRPSESRARAILLVAMGAPRQELLPATATASVSAWRWPWAWAAASTCGRARSSGRRSGPSGRRSSGSTAWPATRVGCAGSWRCPGSWCRSSRWSPDDYGPPRRGGPRPAQRGGQTGAADQATGSGGGQTGGGA